MSQSSTLATTSRELILTALEHEQKSNTDTIQNFIVILKCSKDFIFCKITTVYHLCFKCKKTNSVIPSKSWTLQKEVKDTNIFGIH